MNIKSQIFLKIQATRATEYHPKISPMPQYVSNVAKND